MTIPAIPLAAIMIATTVASTAASVGMQMHTARQQESVRKEQITNANKALAANYDQINLRAQQENAAAGQQLTTNALNALRARGRFRVAADEAGVSGPSIEASLRDLYGQEARYSSAVRTNLDNTVDSLIQQGVAAQNQTESAHANAQQVTPVDWAGAIGNLASGVSGAFMSDFKIGQAGGNTMINWGT